MKVSWGGVFPAVTTHFEESENVDLEATGDHIDRLLSGGVHGLVMLGTVGENCSLSPAEKRDVMRMAVERVGGRVPVLAGVAETTTRDACKFAEDAANLGIDGLMVLPAMVYKSDTRETLWHFREVAAASDRPLMLYNNPPSYGVDVKPEHFAELMDVDSIVAIKESSDDPRRITDLFIQCGERFLLFCGVDDLVLESLILGAVGWVSGLVNAFPQENRALWDHAIAGRWDEARRIYRWYTPLLHLDTHPKLVQYIKLVAWRCGMGSEACRAPRLRLEGEERQKILALVDRAIATRPQ
jgi:4-hydroxy-tetrahydrodipicolinate synthase